MGVEKKLPSLLLLLLAISFVDVADCCFALLFLYYYSVRYSSWAFHVVCKYRQFLKNALQVNCGNFTGRDALQCVSTIGKEIERLQEKKHKARQSFKERSSVFQKVDFLETA